MPSTTPKYKLPYPLGTDPISDGDDSIKALAEKIETVLGSWADYTPTTSAGIVLASGWKARYRRDGQTVHIQQSGLIGGIPQQAVWTFSLPSGLPPITQGVLHRAVGAWSGTRMGGAFYTGTVLMDSGLTYVLFVGDAASSGVNYNTPVVWQVNDIFSFEFSYETSAAPI